MEPCLCNLIRNDYRPALVIGLALDERWALLSGVDLLVMEKSPRRKGDIVFSITHRALGMACAKFTAVDLADGIAYAQSIGSLPAIDSTDATAIEPWREWRANVERKAEKRMRAVGNL